MPYMVVGNEQRLITSSYMAMSKNEASLCVELERENRSATAIYDDLHKLAEESQLEDVVGGQPLARSSSGILARLRRGPSARG